MGRNSGGGGRGGGGGVGIKPNATGGRMRQIRGEKHNTADIVNRAISRARPNLDHAREALGRLGHRSPAESMVRDYAVQHAVLDQIGRMTGSNALGQIGRWNFSSAESIHRDFNRYLDRRIGGQRQRWSQERNKPRY